MKITNMSGLEIGRAVQDRVVTAKEVLDATFARIEEANPKLNAFVYLKKDEAYKEAAAIDEMVMKHPERAKKYPLLGVPVGLKDFLPSYKGWTNSHGGLMAEEQVDSEFSEFTKAALELGAIPIGKTNCPEFAFRGTCDNYKYGPTHNPYDLEYNSGGSSGGSAAAVGGHLVPISEGSDGGGSIRIPASWCNCFGFKPSVGLVPSVCRPDGWTATHPYCFNGCITRTVDDSAVLFKKMAHFDPKDPLSIPIKTAHNFLDIIHESIKGMKIAYTSDFGMFNHTAPMEQVTRSAAHVFEKLGATVDYDIDFTFTHTANSYADMWCEAICVDTCTDLYMQTLEKYDTHKYTDDMEGLPATIDYWHEAVAKSDVYGYRAFNIMRTEIYDQLEKALDKYDLILSPVTTCPPVKNAKEKGQTFGPAYVNGVPSNTIIGFCETFLTNFTGHPSASVPAGFIGGLPVGLQIIGNRWHDSDVFKAAYNYERATSVSHNAAKIVM